MTDLPDFAAICADQTAAFDGLLAEVRRANAEHIAAGGRPDDPPTAWKKTRKD